MRFKLRHLFLVTFLICCLLAIKSFLDWNDYRYNLQVNKSSKLANNLPLRIKISYGEEHLVVARKSRSQFEKAFFKESSYSPGPVPAIDRTSSVNFLEQARSIYSTRFQKVLKDSVPRSYQGPPDPKASDHEQFNHYVNSLDPDTLYRGRGGQPAVRAMFRVAKPSWINSALALKKIEQRLNSSNKDVVEDSIRLISENNLESFALQMIDIHKKRKAEDPNGNYLWPLFALSKMRNSRQAYEYLKQEQHGFVPLDAFLYSPNDEIRKEARKNGIEKLESVKTQDPELGKLLANSSRNGWLSQTEFDPYGYRGQKEVRPIQADSKLSPAMIRILSNNGFPKSVTIEDLLAFAPSKTSPSSYGQESMVALWAAGIIVKWRSDLSCFQHASQFGTQVFGTRERDEDREHFRIAINNKVYRFDLHHDPNGTLSMWDGIDIMNAILEREGNACRVVMLDHTPFLNEPVSSNILVIGSPELLKSCEKEFGLRYVQEIPKL